MPQAPPKPSAERFEREIVPHIELLTKVAMSLLSNRYDAEDLVQDTLLRAFRGLHTFDGRHPRAWLLTIMKNALASRWKAGRNDPAFLSEPENLTANSTQPTPLEPDDAVVNKEFTECVREAVARLSTHHRDVVTLVDLVGLSYEEAAVLLDIPVGTVMSRMHPARARIRRKLASAGLAPPVWEGNPSE